VLNRGFGGSEMADLNYYFNQLILPYNPKQIFIYEGDNDLNSGRDAKFILAYADTLLKKIRAHFPSINVTFISAKPSVARWKLHDKYETFNKLLLQWTKNQHNVSFVDVWSPMLNEKGIPKKELFMQDSLHMNSKGYDIWTKVIEKKIE
jgi:lysophospholipase L1-like esterase